MNLFLTLSKLSTFAGMWVTKAYYRWLSLQDRWSSQRKESRIEKI